jgi:WD40 repeat protein
VVFPEADLHFVVHDVEGHRSTLTPYAGLDTYHITDALSPDGNLLALASGDRAIRLVDVRTGAVRVLGSHADAPTAVTFSWNGRLLASAGRDDVLRLWDVASGTALQSLTGHSNFIFDAMFSRDDKRIVTASTDGTARVWDLASGHVTVLDGHHTAVSSADFSADGNVVMTASVDGAVTKWDLATGRSMVVRRELGQLGFVRFSIDGKLVLTGGDHHVWIWDPSLPRIPEDPAGFAAWLARTTTAEVGAGGQIASR